jgi:hypothetical protein
MMKKVILSFLALFMLCEHLEARTILRKKDPNIPEITIGWKNSKKRITRSNWAYKQDPIFTSFNEPYFNSHHIPADTIPAKNDPNTLYDCRTINKQITHLLSEIKKGKKRYAYFDILKDKNFNHSQRCGLIILRFKNYPLVLKLFMETPKTFIDPYCKGFENQFFFYMSGGMNRYFLGFTRVKNLEMVKEQIENNARWKDLVMLPRKWYWKPKKTRWIEVKGKNIGDTKEITTQMPSVYAIIADELDTKEDAPLLSSKEKSKLIMELCMDLRLFVDPHADNFVIKAIPDSTDYSINIVDTEHFPSVVGLKEEPTFTNHLEWYLYLGTKYFQDAFLQTKYDRREAQYRPNPYKIEW